MVQAKRVSRKKTHKSAMQIWIENMAQGTFKDMRFSFLVVFTENLGAVLKHLPLELVIQSV